MRTIITCVWRCEHMGLCEDWRKWRLRTNQTVKDVSCNHALCQRYCTHTTGIDDHNEHLLHHCALHIPAECCGVRPTPAHKKRANKKERGRNRRDREEGGSQHWK